MTDIIETHGPQGSTMEIVGRRPWRAPRPIDLDDDITDGVCPNGMVVMVGDAKDTRLGSEGTDIAKCSLAGNGNVVVS